MSSSSKSYNLQKLLFLALKTSRIVVTMIHDQAKTYRHTSGGEYMYTLASTVLVHNQPGDDFMSNILVRPFSISLMHCPSSYRHNLML